MNISLKSVVAGLVAAAALSAFGATAPAQAAPYPVITIGPVAPGGHHHDTVGLAINAKVNKHQIKFTTEDSVNDGTYVFTFGWMDGDTSYLTARTIVVRNHKIVDGDAKMDGRGRLSFTVKLDDMHKYGPGSDSEGDKVDLKAFPSADKAHYRLGAFLAPSGDTLNLDVNFR